MIVSFLWQYSALKGCETCLKVINMRKLDVECIRKVWHEFGPQQLQIWVTPFHIKMNYSAFNSFEN